MEEKLKLFAIVELFGHSRISGEVTEQNVAGSAFVRVDVPKTENQPSFSRLFNPQAIYAINPVTQQVMEYAAEQIKSKPIEAYDARQMLDRMLELKQQNQ
ncbi:MAG: hypothetical protein AAF634_05070 [Bacteroidota bacterium]